MKNVLNLITTKDEQEKLLEFLDILNQKMFDPSFDVLDFIRSNAGDKFAPELLIYFGVALNSNESLHELSIELEKQIKALPRIIITSPVDPGEDTIMIVKRHFLDADKPVLIEFVKDHNLIGGAIIEDNGTIFEHSFRAYFEKRRGGENGL